jgi:hypothetical protein
MIVALDIVIQPAAKLVAANSAEEMLVGGVG